MVVRLEPLELAAGGRTEAGTRAVEQALATLLQRPVRPSRTVPGGWSPVVSKVVALLAGTSEERLCRRGGGDLRPVAAAVDACVARGQPIQLYVMWGGIKHYVEAAEQGVDLAEWFALQQFARLRREVASVYPPGLALQVYVEDFGVTYEDAGGQSAEVRARIEGEVDAYRGQMKALVQAVAPGWGAARGFADLVPAHHHAAWWAAADANRKLLSEFWQESEQAPGVPAAQLPTYRRLVAAGWGGELPAATRAHYLARLRNLYPHEEERDRVARLLRYFAVVLLYGQRRLFPHLQLPCVKAALYPPAPGIESGRLSGRLQVRTLPASFSSVTAPPWTTRGCLVPLAGGGLRPALRSIRLLRAGGARVAPLDLITAGGGFRLRGHLLLAEPRAPESAPAPAGWRAPEDPP